MTSRHSHIRREMGKWALLTLPKTATVQGYP